MRLFRRRSDDFGFTLTELVVSLAILLIVIVSAMTTVSYAVLGGKVTERRGRAMNLANQRLEQARNLPYDSVGVTYENGSSGEPPGSIPTPETVDEFVVTTEVSWARDTSTHRATYKRIKVNVSWTSPAPGTVSVVSNVFGSSASMNTGDVEVLVLNADGAAPISGARVHVTPSGSFARLAHTDAEGTTFFGNLPIGTLIVTADADGYLIDTSSVADAQVAADALTRLTLYAQRPSAATVIVADPAGNPIPGATVTLTPQSGAPQTRTTESAGGTVFSNLLIGNYTIAVSASGYTAGTGSFAITEGSQSVQQTVTLSRISGLLVHVTDASGVAIPGASVSVTGPSPSNSQISGSPGTTTSSGDAAFPIATAGTYTVTASTSGYAPSTVTVTAQPSGTSLTIALSVATSGSLKIHTVNGSGRPRGGRQVTVTNSSGYRNTVTTDSNGVYTLTDLVPGRYRVSTSWETKSVDIQAGVESDVTVHG